MMIRVGIRVRVRVRVMLLTFFLGLGLLEGDLLLLLPLRRWRGDDCSSTQRSLRCRGLGLESRVEGEVEWLR
jgi:hypothetical protein